VKPLLEESKGVVHNEPPERLPPMRDTQHHINLISKASLLNLSYYLMNLKESKVLKEEIVSSTEIFEEMKLEHVGEHKSLWKHNASFFVIAKIFSCRKRVFEIQVFNFLSSCYLYWQMGAMKV